MIVAKYKFNPNTYSDYLPEFNSSFTSYTKSDTTNSDGTITRTIESNSLPTRMRFGNEWIDDNYDNEQQPRRDSLLEVISADASSLTSTSAMFRGCSNVTSVDLSNVSNITDFTAMFENCSSLTSLNTSNWNTSKVTNMKWMFSSCSSLTSLDISNWDTSNVTNMDSMFQNCTSLTSLNLKNWNTSKVTNMANMFNGCSSLTPLDLNNFNTSNVTNMSAIFYNCQSLTSLDLNNFNTSKVTGMGAMFRNCSSLTQLDLSNFDTSKVTSMGAMFQNCSSLTSLDVNNFDTSKVTNMNYMFYNCSKLTQLDVSNFDTRNVTSMSNMFQNCFYLKTIDGISNWDVSSVTNMISLFLSCKSLTSLDLSNWNTSKVTDMSNMFTNCLSLRKIKIANATIPQLTDILPTRASDNVGYLLSSVSIPNDKNWETLKFTHNEFYLPQPLRKIGNMKDKLYWDYDKGHYCIEQNINDSLQVLETPNIIDLTEMNQKITFDTYLPDTSIKVTNLPLQPYGLLLEDNTVRYKSTIEPSTLYTIQFNCLAKSTTNLTLDLGGTRVTVEPTIGVNHVQITTPSELTSDRLFLIGTGIIVNEVIVNKGNMRQYTKYFDGEQSVGELQEDGSYIIRISTDNYTSLWEGDL